MTSTPYGVTQAELGRRYTAQMLALGVPTEFEGQRYIPKGYKGLRSRIYRMAGDGHTYDEQERGVVAAPEADDVMPEQAVVEQKVIEVDPATFARSAKPTLPEFVPESEVEIDCDIGSQSPRTIVLKNVTLRNGIRKNVSVTIQPIRVEYQVDFGYLQHRRAASWEEMKNQQDARIAANIAKKIKHYDAEMLRIAIPDLDEDVLWALNPTAFGALNREVEKMAMEAGGNRTDWQHYVQDMYARDGAKYGETGAGIFLWLKEQFAEIEAKEPDPNA